MSNVSATLGDSRHQARPSAENDHGAVRRRTTEAMEVDAEGEAEDEVVWKKRHAFVLQNFSLLN